jgi:hypothetical protein
MRTFAEHDLVLQERCQAREMQRDAETRRERMQPKIKALIAPGEGKRAGQLALACNEDPRFEQLVESSEIPVDCQFRLQSLEMRRSGDIFSEKIFNVELKEPSDYIQSALGKDGHLCLQHLTMRDAGHTAMILVLGGDDEVSAAIRASLVTRYRGQELAFQTANYEARLQDFEAQSFAMHVPVMRWKARPFSRLLSTAAKVLGAPSLMDYRPRPTEGERELCAACCLTKGIGPETWQNVLREYEICLAPRKEYSKPLEEISGMGPKRCKQIADRVRMVYR